MDLVWVNANETLERTIDGHIKTLRAKLRAINQNDDDFSFGWFGL